MCGYVSTHSASVRGAWGGVARLPPSFPLIHNSHPEAGTRSDSGKQCLKQPSCLQTEASWQPRKWQRTALHSTEGLLLKAEELQLLAGPPLPCSPPWWEFHLPCPHCHPIHPLWGAPCSPPTRHRKVRTTTERQTAASPRWQGGPGRPTRVQRWQGRSMTLPAFPTTSLQSRFSSTDGT